MSASTQAFLGNNKVYQRILSQGTGALPMVAVDGELLFTGRYPTYEELRGALQITT